MSKRINYTVFGGWLAVMSVFVMMVGTIGSASAETVSIENSVSTSVHTGGTAVESHGQVTSGDTKSHIVIESVVNGVVVESLEEVYTEPGQHLVNTNFVTPSGEFLQVDETLEPVVNKDVSKLIESADMIEGDRSDLGANTILVPSLAPGVTKSTTVITTGGANNVVESSTSKKLLGKVFNNVMTYVFSLFR